VSIDSFGASSSTSTSDSPSQSIVSTPSVTPIQRSRFLPQLSFRVLLGVVTVAAVLALVGRAAVFGSPFAVAVLFALGTIASIFIVFAVLFLIAWIPAVIGRDPYEDVHMGNPFSADQLPPQVLPPRDPGT
jgi:hypothetical protein